MTTQDIRRNYLEFFKNKGHAIIPRANLVPQEDASTLFTGSGMQPMIPYLLGEEHPKGVRLTNSQVCFRTADIEEVGDDQHTTSFEMLGNWSLGDYYKTDQIKWIAEYMFDIVGLDPNKVYVSCYIGNEKYDIPRDEEAIALWTTEFEDRGVDVKVVEMGSAANGDKLGMQGGRIFLYDGKENWWSRNGDEEGTLIGDPCGPDSEMFYDMGEEHHDESVWGKAHPANDSPRFFEIGNNVFMGYTKTKDGFEKLEKPNIDHGSGLERIAAAKLGDPDIFKIDVLWSIIERLEELSGKKYDDHKQAMQVIADHIKGALFLAVDGVVPSNKEQGYVMRRLLRRAIRFAFELGIEQNFMQEIVPVIAKLYAGDHEEVSEGQKEAVTILMKEEKVFRQTLRKGVRELSKMTNGEALNGEHVFTLYDTYGFPMELSVEEAERQEIKVDKEWEKQFNAKMQEQKERSRTATKGSFKGGLAGGDDIHKKYHTATHLMYQALRDVLGDHVVQRGSNITDQRLRFDFSHPEKVTKEQLQQVEDIVNENIQKDWPMGFMEMNTKKALAEGVLGAFGDKYGDTVKVYTAGEPDGEWFSKEICGGPHVDHTAQLAEDGKVFKIKKEEASSAGVRRIKAILV